MTLLPYKKYNILENREFWYNLNYLRVYKVTQDKRSFERMINFSLFIGHKTEEASLQDLDLGLRLSLCFHITTLSAVVVLLL